MSPSLYQITLSPTNTFRFTTKAGIVYEVYFDNKSGIFPNDAIDRHATFFGFFTIPVTEVYGRAYDKKIGDTIIHILANYLKNYPYSIVTYVCSPKDKQDRARQIAFSKWFNESPLQQKYIFLKKKVGTAYCGVLFSKKHPAIDLIEFNFDDFDAYSKPGLSYTTFEEPAGSYEIIDEDDEPGYDEAK